MKQKALLTLLLLAMSTSLLTAQTPATTTGTAKRASVEEQTQTKESLRKIVLWAKDIVRQTTTNQAVELDRAYEMVDTLTPGQLTALGKHRKEFDRATWKLISASDTMKKRSGSTKMRIKLEPSPSVLTCTIPPCPPAPYDNIHFGSTSMPDTGDFDVDDVASLFNFGDRYCDTRSDASTAAGLAIAVEVFEGISDIVHDIGGEDILGENLMAACLIIDIPKVAVHAALFGVTFGDANVDSAEIQGSFIRLGVVHTNLANLQCTTEAARDAIIAKIGSGTLEIITNANANTAVIVNNDNSNTSSIINNDNSNTTSIIATNNSNTQIVRDDIAATRKELRDLLLRTQIEAALAGNTSVAWYQIPASKGGQLDLVRSIVQETINNTEAVGGRVTEARAKFASADGKKAAGNYKSAYDFYRLAYNQASNGLP